MAFKFGVLGVCLLIVACSAVPFSNEVDGPETTVQTLKSLSKCAESGGVTGMVNCAAVRTLRSLQLLSRQPSLDIFPGVTLQSDDATSLRVGKELNEEELPSNPQDRADKLYELLIDNSARVLSGRTLKVKLPEDVAQNVARSLEEARKKKKGGGMFPFMLRMGAKVMGLVPIAIAGLGLLATKALIIAKIALVLSAILFFQSFGNKAGGLGGSGILNGLGGWGHSIGGSSGYGGSYGGAGSYGTPSWSTNTIGSGSQYPYARSIDVAEGSTNTNAASAHDLAYAKQK